MKNLRLNQIVSKAENNKKQHQQQTASASVTTKKCPYGKGYGEIWISFRNGQAKSE